MASLSQLYLLIRVSTYQTRMPLVYFRSTLNTTKLQHKLFLKVLLFQKWLAMQCRTKRRESKVRRATVANYNLFWVQQLQRVAVINSSWGIFNSFRSSTKKILPYGSRIKAYSIRYYQLNPTICLTWMGVAHYLLSKAENRVQGCFLPSFNPFSDENDTEPEQMINKMNTGRREVNSCTNKLEPIDKRNGPWQRKEPT